MSQFSLPQTKQQFYKYISDANVRELDILKNRSIITAFRGSITHGLYVPSDEPNSTDDVDIMGVVVPGFDHYFGFNHFGSRCTYEHFENHFDIVVYELNKFVSMISQCNPNVLSLLWLNPEHYIHLSRHGQYLIDNRDNFVTSDGVYNAFFGYAHQQFKKMTAGKYEGYMGSKRKALVDKYGYDTKNAAHLFRLLQMGGNYLRTGVLQVEWTGADRDALLDIKNGNRSLEEVKRDAMEAFDWFEYQHDKSVLPEKSMPRDQLSQLVENIISDFMNEHGGS